MASARIMVVEDEVITADHLTMSLNELGYYAPAAVTTGEEAFQKIGEAKPDLILMDIKLDGKLDGIETAHLIKSKANVPVIYLTAYDDPVLLERAKATNPYGYLLKPFRANELHTSIEMALHRHEMEQQGEERVALSRAGFSSIVERSSEGTVLADQNGVVLYANPAAASSFGISKGNSVSAWMRLLKASGGAMEFGGRIGPNEHGTIEANVATTEWNHQSAYLITLRDVTERKCSEKRIRRQAILLAAINKLLREAFEWKSEQEAVVTCLQLAEKVTSSKFSWMSHIDADGTWNVTAMNSSGWESCGISTAEALRLIADIDSKGLWDSIVKNGHAEILHAFSSRPDFEGLFKDQAVMTALMGIPVQEAGKIVGVMALGNKDGSYHPFDAQDAEALSFAFIEALDRRRVKDALSRSEERMRRLIEDSPVGIGIIQKEKYCYVNPQLLKMMECDNPDLIVGMPVDEFVSPEDRSLFLKRYMNRLAGTGSTLFYEAKGLKKTGKPFDMDLYPRLIEFQGEPAVLVFITDKTEEKSLRNQLSQAQKMEAIGTLAGGVAHDFNNLLQIIVGYSELLLLHKDLSEEFRTKISAIDSASRRGAELVKRLLTLSKNAPIEPTQLNLNQQVEQIHKMLSRTIPKMVEIRLEPGENLGLVNADATQMDQILMNLAVNARDAMPDGGKIVIKTENIVLDAQYCSTHLNLKPGPYVLLTVSDNGQGMSRETMQHIFEPFFTTKKVGKGTGLGLATVYGIVKQHGGHISCHSQPGQGTTFSIYLPMVAEKKIHPGIKTESGEIPLKGTETILIVDDDKIIIELVKEMLSNAGYKTLIAHNGLEALEIYKREGHAIDLVILDLLMPEMGGEQCLEQLLHIDPKVRVLISSGFTPESDDQTTELVEKSRGFIHKPYKAKNLLKMLREVLDADKASSLLQ